MKTALVGYTGFVGSNLDQAYKFDYRFNSRNIAEAFGLKPDMLIYAGVRAEKFLANANPDRDRANMLEAFENIKRIAPKKLVLISTVDVYKNPKKVDENSIINTEELQPYGANRYFLEQCVRSEYPDALIVRLPGLYGINIKKNFIYDFIHPVPSMLNADKFRILSVQESAVKEHYCLQENGYYKCNVQAGEEYEKLKEAFSRQSFSALNFTDSRGIYQFYPLKNLWHDIEIALNADVRLINMATEPVAIDTLYCELTGEKFVNCVSQNVPDYDFRTIHSDLYHGEYGYLYGRETIISDIKNFIRGQMR